MNVKKKDSKPTLSPLQKGIPRPDKNIERTTVKLGNALLDYKASLELAHKNGALTDYQKCNLLLDADVCVAVSLFATRSADHITRLICCLRSHYHSSFCD